MWILATVITVFVVSLVALRHWMRRAGRFTVSVTAPSHVQLGEQCVIELQITNNAKRALVLEMVSADDALTTHFDGLCLMPAPKTQTSALGGRAWSYRVEMKPNAIFSVSFTGRAARAGMARGEIQAITTGLIGAAHLVEIDVGAS